MAWTRRVGTSAASLIPQNGAAASTAGGLLQSSNKRQLLLTTAVATEPAQAKATEELTLGTRRVRAHVMP